MAVMTRNNSDKRVIRTKKAIRTALFKLMESKDIASITISELTTLANVNRRTFYTHYSNITDILDETESEIVEAVGGNGESTENFVSGGFQHCFHAGHENSAEIAFHQVEVEAVFIGYQTIQLYENVVGAVYQTRAVKLRY